MATQRRFRQGDGTLTIGPGEVVLLHYMCAACGRAYEVSLQGNDRPMRIDCNEDRLCDGCQKKDLVMMLLERGTNVPEETLLEMTVDDLLDLAEDRERGSRPSEKKDRPQDPGPSPETEGRDRAPSRRDRDPNGPWLGGG